MEVGRYNGSYVIPDFRDRTVRSRPPGGNHFRFAPSERSLNAPRREPESCQSACCSWNTPDGGVQRLASGRLNSLGRRFRNDRDMA